MMRLPRSLSSSALVLGSVLGLATLQGGTAEAGHGHFGGSVHVSGGFHGGFRAGASVHFARPAVRPIFRPRVWVGGHWWWNSYWWWPRPYYYYYPEYVPSYYGGTYYPVQPGVAAPGEAPIVPRRPPLPTLGFGVFAGGTSVNGMKDASELGLLGRLRLTPGLLVEAELAKDTFSGSVAAACPPGVFCVNGGTANGDRVDRRIGGSLIWEIGPHNSFAPYLLAGGGVQQAKVTSGDFFGSDFTTTQDFGEVGAGLRWALSRNLHLTADIRAGRRWTIDSNQTVTPVARGTTINPPSGGPNGNTEDYTRARIAAVVNF